MAVARTPWWTWNWPVLAWLLLLMLPLIGTGGFVGGVAGVVLLATVFAAVYHAEVVAHRVGEPFGTMKARMGATHFLTKTLPKVAAEMALSVLAYNLKRVINIVGIRPLIAAIVA